LTYGYPYGGTADAYPAQLASLLAASVYNGGVNGETSTQIKNRMVAATDKSGHVAIIWAGINNYTSGSTVISDIAVMVASLAEPKRYVVMSLLTGTNQLSGSTDYTQVMTINNALAAAYPDNFLDIRGYLVSQYDSGVPQDVTDHGHDIVPSTLRFDFIHLNPTGYLLVAQSVQERLWAEFG
jgi:lysophospholipase L1-like esterase